MGSSKSKIKYSMSQIEEKSGLKQSGYAEQDNNPSLNQSYENDFEAESPGLNLANSQMSAQNSKYNSHNDSSLVKGKKGRDSYKGVSLLDLRRILKERTSQTTELKTSVTQKRKKLRDIENHLDREMIKNIVNKNQQPNVTIRQIFSQTSTNTDNTKVIQLQNQLRSLRKQINDEKSKVQKLQDNKNDPISAKNYEEARILNSAMAEKDHLVQILKIEKETILKQNERIKRVAPEVYIEGCEQEQRKLKKQISELIRDINNTKLAMHEEDRNDRIVSEKTRFIQQVLNLLSENAKERHEKQVKQKQETEQTIKGIGNEIRQFNDQMLKIEAERNATFKNLSNQFERQGKLKEQQQKEIRTIEGYFMKRTLIKRDNQRRAQQIELKRIEEAKKQQEAKIRKERSLYMSSNQLNKSIEKKSNQSGMLPPTKIMEENENEHEQPDKCFYQLGIELEDQSAMIANDEYMGDNLTLQKLCFTFDETFIYGVKAEYTDGNGQKVEGYSIVSKVLPKGTEQKQLELQPYEKIVSFDAGLDTNSILKFIKIETSQGKKIEWGNTQNCTDVKTHAVPDHRYMTVKGSLKHTIPESGANNLCLVGLGFTIAK